MKSEEVFPKLINVSFVLSNEVAVVIRSYVSGILKTLFT